MKYKVDYNFITTKSFGRGEATITVSSLDDLEQRLIEAIKKTEYDNHYTSITILTYEAI